MNRREFSRKLGSLVKSLAAIAAASSVAACATGTGTLSLSTTDIDKDAQALAFLVNTVVSSQIFSKTSTETQNSITSIVKQITETTATIASASGGTISVDTSATWAKSLISEVSAFLEIAQPVAAQYNKSIATYLGLARQILPFLQTMIDTASATKDTSTTAIKARSYAVPMSSPASIRAAIYRGPSA